MILFSIAKNNIKKNIKDYFLYLASIVFTVSIYFTFKVLEANPTIDKVLSGSSKVSAGFKAASIVIALFSILFIMYSNNFFIKKRKKEIGLYALLGIENKDIGRMLFFETLIIGVISLVLGIVLGILFSMLSIQMLKSLIGLNLNIVFSLPIISFVETSVLFIIVFLVIAYQSNNIIYSYQLIELFKASSKSEKPKNASIILSLLSIAFIFYGYYNYLNALKGGNILLIALITLVTVVIGTYLLFGSLVYYVIKNKRNNKTKYFNGLNMVSTSQLLYRVRSNSKMLATISILSATTLTAVGIATAMYLFTSNNIDSSFKHSYTLKGDNKDYINEFENILAKYPNHKVLGKESYTYVSIPVLEDTAIYGASNKIETQKIEIEKNVISLSNFKALMKLNGKDANELLNNSEFLLVSNTVKELKNQDLNVLDRVTIDSGSKFDLKIKSTIQETIYSGYSVDETIVVSDNIFNSLKNNYEVKNKHLYNIDNAKNSEDLDKEVTTLSKKYAPVEGFKSPDSLRTSYYMVYKEAFSTAGVMVFIGVFLGLVFLICTGSIIFFKLLSEAQEEAHRYKILTKIGVDENDIKSSVYKQVGFNFFVPLIVGCSHSLVATYLVGGVFFAGLYAKLLAFTLIPYIVIYVIYYLVTAKVYYKTIMNQN